MLFEGDDEGKSVATLLLEAIIDVRLLNTPNEMFYQGGIRVYGDVVLSYFWYSFAVFLVHCCRILGTV